ncbi:3-oxoacyl-[acyl-carrier protein] reductase [Kineosphaera limosa]|uniref:3-oxoacyl-[acyl-carrier-protein] reductase n=1 Tax=Kineosphaera limosa NBRC 100340 TaxID=1184609 RepID=K6XCQ4_9MICO|nr:SDR family NAD(P)-dependent oxidoreductase [Kineosphaera limosa]NYE01199.1 3-oxoacyl-[acyl-carrier protein] reductase [Kineosphaera limosa]GAB96599.1 3-oxoacyl-[acyl-carrier-protein] reductase [Kineosphaera limosa NBRC 100340]
MSVQAAPQVTPGRMSGKVAVVTGVGPGLGRAIAVRLGAEGASVVVCDISEDAVEQTRQEVEAVGAQCLAMRCDVSDSSQVAALFAAAVQRFGSVHALVNNAAITPNSPADTERRNRLYGYMQSPVARTSLEITSSIEDDEWHRFWGVNVHGVFYCTREALRLMEPQQYGRIVNVASIAGISARSAHSPHYSATKGAVVAFTRSVAYEVAGANIFVNALAPGGVATPAFNAYLDGIGEEGRNRLWQSCPAGRFGTVEEYAATVAHLASDEHYLVGQIISPNGGSAI